MTPVQHRIGLRRRWAIAALLASASAQAESFTFEITPAHPTGGSNLAFKITHAGMQNGDIAFHVVITGSGKSLSSLHGWNTSLGDVNITANSESIDCKKLPSRSTDRAIESDFSISRASLKDPNFSFVLSDYPVPGMPDVEFYYARLKNFTASQ